MRIRTFLPVAVLAASSLSGAAQAADARSILETARDKQVERWEGVNLYVVNQSLMGISTQTYMQRVEIEDDAGETQTLFLPAQPADLEADRCGSVRRMTPDELDAYAAGLEMTGEATAQGIEDGLEEAGLPRELLGASGSDPSATFDPRVMMGGGAGMYRALAEAERERAANPDRAADEARASASHMAEFMRTAKLVGTESVDGREAYHLQASGMDHVQDMENQQYRMDTLGMWVDTETYVPLRMKVEGVLTSGNESRPMVIEQHQSDYRSVPGSNMYEPFKQVMKISGMMDAEQEAQMREAQQQMAQLEAQMAEMPANQRAMMENLMGPQLEMMRTMAAGGGFQTEIRVSSIAVNPPSCDVAPSAASSSLGVFPGSAPARSQGPAAAPSRADLRQAQQTCLERRAEQAQRIAKTEQAKEKRGFGRLLSGVRGVTGRLTGTAEEQPDVAEVTRDVYDGSVSSADLAAAETLGLTRSDIDACEAP